MAKLIHIVGVSGTGKTLTHDALKEKLTAEGYKVEALVEPGPLRDFAKNYRLSQNKNSWTEAAIFTTDRLMIYQEKVFPRINEKDLVFLSSRSLFDTFVYQGILGGVDLEVIKKMNSPIPFPDLALCLTVEGKVGYKRILERNIISGEQTSKNETPEAIDRLSAHYMELPKHFPQSNIEVIDTTNLKMPEQIKICHDKIIGILNGK